MTTMHCWHVCFPTYVYLFHNCQQTAALEMLYIQSSCMPLKELSPNLWTLPQYILDPPVNVASAVLPEVCPAKAENKNPVVFYYHILYIFPARRTKLYNSSWFVLEFM